MMDESQSLPGCWPAGGLYLWFFLLTCSPRAGISWRPSRPSSTSGVHPEAARSQAAGTQLDSRNEGAWQCPCPGLGRQDPAALVLLPQSQDGELGGQASQGVPAGLCHLGRGRTGEEGEAQGWAMAG